MHYIESQLENQIVKAKKKPTVTLKELNFSEAFHVFLKQIDAEYDVLYEGGIESLNSSNTKCKTMFGISYGRRGHESSTVFVSAEQSANGWVYTFTDAKSGLYGDLRFSSSVDDDEEDELDEWRAEENGKNVLCRKCGHLLGEKSAYGLGFEPSKEATVTEIQVNEIYEGDPEMELFIRLECKKCGEENGFSERTYLE